jgi:hypothetical protein
MENLLLSK